MASLTNSFGWQAIAPCGCRPVYGFHEVEEDFVWSTFSFGFLIPTDEGRNGTLVLLVHNPHAETTLTCRISGDLFSTQVPSGQHRVAIPAEWSGEFADFQIQPKILLASDVRELGLLFHQITREANLGNACRQFARIGESVVLATEAEQDPLERLQRAGSSMAREILSGFLKEGWFKANHVNNALKLQLHVSSRRISTEKEFLGEGNSLKCRVAIDAREEEVVFLQDSERRNIFWAELSIPKVTGKDCGLMDYEEPIDIQLQPNAFGDYQWQTVHWRGRGRGALPSDASIVRVAGRVGVENFLLHGASWFVKLDRIANSRLAGGLSGCGRIVDWGCGCARISRHFLGNLADKLVGYDIDPVNIEWCRRNIPGGCFELCSVVPPLALDSESVDVLFAHSVLTHLGEEHQDLWLDEISRVLRPGGIACLTVLAELSWYARFLPQGQTPEAVAQFLEKGFINHGWLKELGVDSNCPGAYVSASHSQNYVHNRWRKRFEILDWIDGFADLQSLVVLGKKPVPPTPIN